LVSRKTKWIAVIGVTGVVGIPASFARSQVDATRLPLGKTTLRPQRSGLWSCRTEYPANAVGAFRAGPWISSDGTWKPSAKLIVDGIVRWPKAELSVARKDDIRLVRSKGVPIRSTTGVYPIQSNDDAYAYDRNPNSIRTQTISISLPLRPAMTTPTCVGNAVGISLDGPAIFSAVDEAGRDAVAYELQDSCNGHPEVSGTYHYHGLSNCAIQKGQFGWALDGFAIWGPVDPVSGKTLNNRDLDECHGITSKITIDGKAITTYHYVANSEYPYTVGCFRGTPTTSPLGAPPGPPPQPHP
jgi:YHYH protein